MTSRVLRFDPDGAHHLRGTLEAWGLDLEEREHALFLARDADAVVTAYPSGKLLVQGGEADRLADHLMARDDLGVTAGAEASGPLGGGPSRPRIGTDEAGKGDYFGPLVVAGVALEDEAAEDALAELDVRESKVLDDAEAFALARAIRDRVPHRLVVLPPPRYNDLHDRIGNLNHLLAWAHARCFEDLLEEHPVDLLVTDRFADAAVLEDALMDRARERELVQEPRGERDVAVAAASVLARAAFLRGLHRLEAEHDVTLPKGAGEPVLEAGRRVVDAGGEDALREVAKVHFRTTDRILEG